MGEVQADDGWQGLTGKRYLVLEICILMFLLWLPSFWGGLQNLLSHWRSSNDAGTSIGRLISNVGGIGILAFVLWGAGERFGRFGMGRPRIRDLGIFAAALLLCAAQDVVVGTVWWIRTAPHIAPIYPQDNSFPWLFWLFTTVVTLMSAAYQEILMRGYLITRLEDLWENKWSAFAVSCLLFGLWHLYQGGRGIVTSTTMGVIFGLLFLRYRRLWPLVAAHATVNMLISAHAVGALVRWLAGFYGSG